MPQCTAMPDCCVHNACCFWDVSCALPIAPTCFAASPPCVRTACLSTHRHTAVCSRAHHATVHCDARLPACTMRAACPVHSRSPQHALLHSPPFVRTACLSTRPHGTAVCSRAHHATVHCDARLPACTMRAACSVHSRSPQHALLHHHHACPSACFSTPHHTAVCSRATKPQCTAMPDCCVHNACCVRGCVLCTPDGPSMLSASPSCVPSACFSTPHHTAVCSRHAATSGIALRCTAAAGCLLLLLLPSTPRTSRVASPV